MPQLGCPFTVLLPSFAGVGLGSLSSSSSSSSSYLTAVWDFADFCFFPQSFGPACCVFFLSLPKYFLPVNTLDNCFACTWNNPQACFAIPALKNLQFSFNQTTAANILVLPFFSCCSIATIICLGKIIFWTFSTCFSTDICVLYLLLDSENALAHLLASEVSL